MACAASDVTAILKPHPSAVELIDDLSLRWRAPNRRRPRAWSSFVKGEPFCFLVVEYHGDSEAELRSKDRSLISQAPNLPISPLL
jgi:hypothetical protein